MANIAYGCLDREEQLDNFDHSRIPPVLGQSSGMAAGSSLGQDRIPPVLRQSSGMAAGSSLGQDRMDQVCLKISGKNVLISRITDRQGSWISFKQLITSLIPWVPRETVKALLKKAASRQRNATQDETAFLYTSCAVKSRAAKIVLYHQAGVLACLKLVKNAEELNSLLQSFHTLPPYKEGLLPCNLPPSADRPQPEGQPSTLPANPVPAAMLQMHYTLPKRQRSLQPFREQLADMEAWCKQPIQLDRAGSSISSSTWDNIGCSILLYLGFQHRFMGVEAPTLESFTNAHMYSSYMAFQVAKDKSINSHTQSISHCKKVLTFLGRARAAGTASSTAHVSPSALDGVHVWLNRLRQQLISYVPRKKRDIGDMLETGKWIGAEDLVRLVQDFASSTLSSVPRLGACDVQLARTLHNASLVSCLFSHLPPLRLICLRTLQTPITPGCLSRDCRRPGCLGNRLTVDRDGSLRMILSHYKVDRKWDRAVMNIKLPEQLSHLLLQFLGKGHSITCGQQPYVFTKHNGQPMAKAADMSTYWTTLLQEIGCTARFSPHVLRHIFVDERRGPDMVAGPEDSGAAMVMGNTEREWTASYDLHYRGRESQRAVDCMSVWRNALLERSANRIVPTNAVPLVPLAAVVPPPPAADRADSVVHLSSDEE